MGDAVVSGGGGISCQPGGGQISGAAYGDQTSVVVGGGYVSDFNESEGDNADAIEGDNGPRNNQPAMDSVIADQEDSGDAASAQSTGKMDPQAPGWTRRVRVGKQPQPPDRAPCPDRFCALEQMIRGYAAKLLGFGIRYGKSKLNAEKTKCMQEVVCGCSEMVLSYTVQLTRDTIESVFDHEGDPDLDHMVSVWRLVRKEEAKLFRGLPERFRVIPDFRVRNMQEELMEAERSSDLDFDYIATMISEEHTGVRIEAAKNVLPLSHNIMLLLKYMDSWAVYSVDLQKKIVMIMDPVETEEPWHEMEAKHKRNTIRVGIMTYQLVSVRLTILRTRNPKN